jgi:hypothetical protein
MCKVKALAWDMVPKVGLKKGEDRLWGQFYLA